MATQMDSKNSLDNSSITEKGENSHDVVDVDADVLRPNEQTLHRGLQARQVSFLIKRNIL